MDRLQTLEKSAPVAPVQASDVTIIWHLGFIKTGTTAIQQMLRRAKGVFPPEVTAFRRSDEAVHVRLTCKKWRKEPSAENKAEVFDAVRDIREKAVKRGARFALLSDENIVEFEPYSARGDIFEAAEKTIPLLEEAAYPAKSVFVFYTRDFTKWLKSAHNQTVKMLRLDKGYPEYRDAVPFEMDWQPHKDRLCAAVSSEVVFHDMADDLEAGKPLGAGLLSLAGLGGDVLKKLPTPDRKNESLSPEALKFMLQVNKSDLSNAAVRKIRQLVIQNPAAFE